MGNDALCLFFIVAAGTVMMAAGALLFCELRLSSVVWLLTRPAAVCGLLPSQLIKRAHKRAFDLYNALLHDEYMPLSEKLGATYPCSLRSDADERRCDQLGIRMLRVKSKAEALAHKAYKWEAYGL